MPQSQNLNRHVKPFVDENPVSKALHFSMFEVQSRMQRLDPHALALEDRKSVV